MKPKSDTTKQPLKDSKVWRFTGYDKNGNEVETFVINDRTAHEANNECMHHVEANQNIDDWSLTPEPDSKEGLHTQGEWKIKKEWNEFEIRATTPQGLTVVATTETKHLSHIGTEQAKANAELIVKAVNERKALLDSHRELKEAIEFYQKGVDHFFKCINWGKSFLDAEAIQFMNDHAIKFNKAINNSKNIQQ